MSRANRSFISRYDTDSREPSLGLLALRRSTLRWVLWASLKVQVRRTLATTTSYTATGLTQNTYYDAYVMANCTSTGDGTSNWVGPFTFKTECGDQAVPYSNGFEGFSSGNTTTPNLPDCWAYGKTGTSTSLYAYNYRLQFYANTGTNSVRFYGYAKYHFDEQC